MLVGADDGRVDENAVDLAELRVGRKQFEERAQAAGGEPAAEAVVDGVPVAELAGQVAPGDAGAGQIEQGLEEVPVGEFRHGTLAVAFGLLHQRLEGRPEVVREQVAHGIVPRPGGC